MHVHDNVEQPLPGISLPRWKSLSLEEYHKFSSLFIYTMHARMYFLVKGRPASTVVDLARNTVRSPCHVSYDDSNLICFFAKLRRSKSTLFHAALPRVKQYTMEFDRPNFHTIVELRTGLGMYANSVASLRTVG